jgi:hypothetical protein
VIRVTARRGRRGYILIIDRRSWRPTTRVEGVMNTTTNFSVAPNRDQLDMVCARFPGLRGADAARWLAAGDRLGVALCAAAARLARMGAMRRADRRDADRLAYGL